MRGASGDQAQDKLKGNRPSIYDENDELEGAKNRPKQSGINSTDKSRQRADDGPPDPPVDSSLRDQYRW
jgi:hypothetical protein